MASALRCGVRLIDTASIYKNEEHVAEGIARSGIAREEVVLVSKASAYEAKGYDETLAALRASLQRLRTTYLDLYLLHWPGIARVKHGSERHATARAEAWRALEEAKAEGLCRFIGVSNYEPVHLEVRHRWQYFEASKYNAQERMVTLTQAFWDTLPMGLYCRRQCLRKGQLWAGPPTSCRCLHPLNVDVRCYDKDGQSPTNACLTPPSRARSSLAAAASRRR